MKGSSFLNRMQFGYTRSRLDGVDYLLEGFSMPQTTFTDINRGLAALGVTGLSGLGGDTTNPKFHIFNNYQIRENVTWNRGIQNIKFGGDMQILHTPDLRLHVDGPVHVQLARQLPHFPCQPVQCGRPGSDASRDLRQMAFGFYVQDDIQARKNLTINLGLRYEPTNSVTDTQDRLAQLIDFTSPTATLNDTTTLTKLFKNPSLKTVAPRVGFAWDVAGDGKTAIRGGVGMFYDLVLISTPFVQNTAVRVPPYFNRGGLVGSSSFVVNFPDAYTTQAAQLAAQAQLEGIQYHSTSH